MIVITGIIRSDELMVHDTPTGSREDAERGCRALVRKVH